jgi:methionyl-tRNA synthetase
LGKYKGSYCISCEDYISENKIIDNNSCSFCHSQLRIIEEPAYFLRVSKYYPNLIEYYEKNPHFLLPLGIKKELTENFLKNDVRDLCITRRDVKWGVSVPHNNELTIYV